MAGKKTGTGDDSRKEPLKAIKKSVFDVKKIKKSVEKPKEEETAPRRDFLKTGITGLDELLGFGIPRGSNVIVAGGSGSGKTLLCLQILANAAKEGRKCLFMSFEESESSLLHHIEDFGFYPRDMKKRNMPMIKRFSSFDVSRSIDALLAKSRGDLYIDVKPLIIPKGLRPDIIVVDSLSSIASIFTGHPSNYRNYIEQLFRYFEDLGSTTFLISETEQVPRTFSPTGVEEFLADGVIVLYNIRKGDVRESAIEVLKMRGSHHKKSIVAMQILSSRGVEVYPDQQVFSKIE